MAPRWEEGVHTDVEAGPRHGWWSKATVVPGEHPAEPAARGGLAGRVPRHPHRANQRQGRASPCARPVTARCIAPGKCQSSQTVESFVPKIICANNCPDYFFFYYQIFFFFFFSFSLRMWLRPGG